MDRIFKKYQKLCKREFKKAELDYVNKTIQEVFENNNSKPFWRYIKSKRQDNIGIAPLKQKGSLFSDRKDKAQILVDQFRSVFTIIIINGNLCFTGTSKNLQT